MKKILVSVQTLGLMALAAAPAFAQNTVTTEKNITVPKLGPVNITDLGYLIGAVMGFLLIVAAIIAFIYLILGGIQWITSGGDKAGLEGARNKITNAIVGLIVVAAAWAIMALVQNFLGFNLFGGQLPIPKAFDTDTAGRCIRYDPNFPTTCLERAAQ